MILDNSWLFTIFRSRNFSDALFSTVLPHGTFLLFQNTLILIRIPNEKQAFWVLLTFLLTIFCTRNFLLLRLFLDILAHVARILLKTTSFFVFFRTSFLDKFLALFCCHSTGTTGTAAVDAGFILILDSIFTSWASFARSSAVNASFILILDFIAAHLDCIFNIFTPNKTTS